MNRNAITAEAVRWIGTPYHHQGSTRGAGCDCLGLVRGTYRALYGPEPVRLPAYAQYDTGEGERLIAELRAHLRETSSPLPGDILVFRLRERYAATLAFCSKTNALCMPSVGGACAAPRCRRGGDAASRRPSRFRT